MISSRLNQVAVTTCFACWDREGVLVIVNLRTATDTTPKTYCYIDTYFLKKNMRVYVKSTKEWNQIISLA